MRSLHPLAVSTTDSPGEGTACPCFQQDSVDVRPRHCPLWQDVSDNSFVEPPPHKGVVKGSASQLLFACAYVCYRIRASVSRARSCPTQLCTVWDTSLSTDTSTPQVRTRMIQSLDTG